MTRGIVAEVKFNWSSADKIENCRHCNSSTFIELILVIILQSEVFFSIVGGI